MDFLDCRLSYGKYINGGPYKPCADIDELAREMLNSGILGGFVYNAAADTAGAAFGNEAVCFNQPVLHSYVVDLRVP
jgi:hypothetical protein